MKDSVQEIRTVIGLARKLPCIAICLKRPSVKAKGTFRNKVNPSCTARRSSTTSGAAITRLSEGCQTDWPSGARVMLRRNMRTSDGLVNGAMGTVVSFEWPEGQRIMGQQPCGINILIDDQRVERQTRGTSDHVATTIQAATSRFNGKDGRHQFERYQNPIVLAWSVTIHGIIVHVAMSLENFHGP